MGSGLTDQLEALVLGTPSPSGTTDLRVVLSKLAVEVRQRLDKGSPSSYDFLVSVVKGLSRIRGGSHAELRMACLYDCSAFFLTNRFGAESLQAAAQVELLARQSGNKTWIRKALMVKGIACAHLGDVGDAVFHYTEALVIARELNDAEGEGSVLSNLGSALNYAGLYREAIPCFLRAIALAKTRPEARPYATAALCNMAQSYCALGEFDSGMASIVSSLATSDEPRSAVEAMNRAVREFTFVQLALELGKLSAAREHSRICAAYARQSGVRKAEFLAEICAGLCEIHGGDVDRGLATLEKALATSGDQGSTEYMTALTALVKGYDQTYQAEKALRAMSTLLTVIKGRRERGVGALLSLDSGPSADVVLAPESKDLAAWTTREAVLRAQVAERVAANARIEMIERLAITADLREEVSGEHGYRVGKLASSLAVELDWSPDACHTLDLAARLHDVGKIAVPDRILLNSKELQEAERHFISTHTIIGAELLAKSNIPQLRMAEEIARHHHEWWNGEGYPSKLKGKRIPIHARIVALADVFDALTHGRPFSEPWPMDKALEEIRARKGTQFDPELTDLFLELIAKLRAEHEDLDEYLGRAGRNSPFLQARNKIRLMLAEERENEKSATVAGNQTRH